MNVFRALLPLLLAAVAAPAFGADVVQDTVLQETLVRLDERLADADPVHAVQLLQDVAAATGRTPEQVRRHLRARLDAFDRLGDTDAEAWKAVLGLRAETMSSRQARRLLRQLSTVSGRILRSDSDYLVGTGIRYAAHEAHVPEAEAEAYARRLVAFGIVDTTTAWAPEPVGLVVSGWTEPYEYNLGPLYIFFDTEDEAFVREAMRDVQRFVVPRLVRRLPASRGVQYAVRDRDATALIDPKYDLHVTVLGLRFSGTNADLLPCMDVTASLVATATGVTAWETTASHCTQTHGSATTHELDAFYDEIADLLFARVDEHFETR